MMYLVLTAILALNVSKEILDAFVVVNVGLLHQKENLESKNKSMLTGFANSMADDSGNARLQMIYKQAITVNQLSDSISNYIEEMKVDLVKAVDKVDRTIARERVKTPGLVSRKDDYDRPTYFFGTSDPPGNKGKAHDLRLRLAEYKQKLLAIADLVLADTGTVNREALKKEIASKIDLIDTEDPVNTNDARSWEMHYFYHLPLSAALTELTRWQNFVQGAASDMLSFLWNETDRQLFKFDKVRAAVIPQATFVTSGSNFEADVFLAAYSTSPTNRPTIILGSDVDSITGEVQDPTMLPIENIVNGVGKVKIPVSGLGEHKLAGVIKYTDPQGQERVYPFKTRYNVAPPTATASATKMNVFYIGLDNPLSVSVPGVAPNKISVSGTNCSVTGSNGSYNVRVTGGREAIIRINAEMPDGTRHVMGEQKFRIKQVPIPEIKIGGDKHGKPVSRDLLAVSPLIPDMADFVFDGVYAEVQSYSLFFTTANGSTYRKLNIRGNIIPEDAKPLIKQLPRGAKVYFDDIRVSVAGSTRTTYAIATIK